MVKIGAYSGAVFVQVKILSDDPPHRQTEIKTLDASNDSVKFSSVDLGSFIFIDASYFISIEVTLYKDNYQKVQNKIFNFRTVASFRSALIPTKF